jgi:dolichyl-phosphate-mannose-protein mannosyltransferase
MPPTAQDLAAPPPARTRWFHWIILAILLAVGAGLRFHGIARESEWPDEFWGIYLATGRGDAAFDLPRGVILDPPPAVGMTGAAPWWHIWNGLSGAVHPPLYFVLIRWWMDLFGDSDFSTRGFSAVVSLAAIVILFDALRRMVGATGAILAAGMMALAVPQIDLSQQARNYTLATLTSLIALHAMARIETRGVSAGRLVQLFIGALATALTHYLAAGGLVGLGIYSLLRWRGVDRMKSAATLVLAALAVAAMWGAQWRHQQHLVAAQRGWTTELQTGQALPFRHAIEVTSSQLYGQPDWPAPIAAAMLIYLLPVLLIRARPQTLLWWTWAVGCIGLVFAVDFCDGTRLLTILKYTLCATPAFFALLAWPLPLRGGGKWIAPAALAISVAVAAAARLENGPPFQGDWRNLMQKVNRRADADSPLLFYADSAWGSGTYWYLAFAHYAPDSHRPIVMLDSPATPQTMAVLSRYKQIWAIGNPSPYDASQLLPGWKVVESFGGQEVGMAQRLVPPAATTGQ